MTLRWLIAAIGLAGVRADAMALAHRVKLGAATAALLALLWSAAFGFALAALTVWLAGVVGIAGACAIVAAALTAIGLGAHLALAIRARRRPAPTSAPRDRFDGGAEPRLAPVGLAMVAGFLLARGLRR